MDRPLRVEIHNHNSGKTARSARIRLDQALVEAGLCESREKAKRAILAGQVEINGQRAAKPSDWVRSNDRLTITTPDRYVSRGGHKLAGALTAFQLKVEGFIAVDLGASTGGFTDCLLQEGALRVYAVDVGQGQLAWKLRQDPRVVVMEKTNARYLLPAHLPDFDRLANLVVIDCSFISLRHLLLTAVALLQINGKIVALIKPQFEAGKLEVDRGRGVITDPLIHERVIAELRQYVSSLPNLQWIAAVESPLIGPAGNKEFFVMLEKTA